MNRQADRGDFMVGFIKRTPCYRVSFSYSVHHRGLLQSLLYIRNDVVYILNAHGEAD